MKIYNIIQTHVNRVDTIESFAVNDIKKEEEIRLEVEKSLIKHFEILFSQIIDDRSHRSFLLEDLKKSISKEGVQDFWGEYHGVGIEVILSEV